MNQSPPQRPDPPRLPPRGVWRPRVAPDVAVAFGRPPGNQARITSGGAPVPPAPSRLAGPPVPEMLGDAFGRPPGDGPTLGRPPAAAQLVARPEPGDPWRNPDAVVQLGEPALATTAPEAVAAPTAQQYTLREALFRRRLRPSAVVGLLLLCLVIGAGGALAGVLVASRLPTPVTSPDIQLGVVRPGVERAPGSVSDIAARVVPTVVSIEIRAGESGGTGSGVVIDGRGYIITNNHVISQAVVDPEAELTVVFNDGKSTRAPARIVGRDPRTDLAVLKVEVNNATVAQLGDSSALRVGDAVIAIGSPLGLAGTVTTGILSAKDRPVRLQGADSDTDAVIDALQTDAAVNPGNSGGALVDSTGAVVGINTAIRTLGGETSGSIGLGFAIPINRARVIAEELIRTGKVVHASMGVNARSATDGTTDGAQVQNVVEGGPAAKAGIQEGDVILRVGGRSVADADELVVAVQALEVGQTVPVVLTRSGRSLTVQVTLGAE